QLTQKVRESAYEILKHKGTSNLGIGVVASRLAAAILLNQELKIPLSLLCKDEYNLDEIAIGCIARINSQGVKHELIDLSEEMLQKLAQSAAAIKNVQSTLEF